VVERGADVGLKPVELMDEGRGMGAHLPGRCAEAVLGHGFLEAVQPLPSAQ